MSEDKKAKIIEAISEMTVLELAELVEEMEEKFGVSASAPAVAAVAAPAEGGKEEEQTEFDVVLEDFGAKKIQVIKVVREITGLGLKEAKALVDEAPSKVKEELDKSEAEEIQKQLEEAGATVKLQ